MSNPVPTPRTAKFPSTEILWSDGSKYNGFALLGFIPPKDGSYYYSVVDYGNASPTEQLPQFAVVPIINGQFNGSVGLYYSADTAVPGMQYNISFYDTTKRLIAGPSAAFTVDTDPITLTIPTLTAPSTGGTPPTPDS